MTKKNKQIILTVSLGILALLLIQSPAYGLIMGNQGDQMFTTNEETTGTGDESIGVTAGTGMSQIGIYIAKSAGYFLRSQASMLRMLDKVEMADSEGFDYYNFRLELCAAIENMEMSKLYYTLLKKTASDTPYNPDRIKGLVSFDYDRFRVERGLNAVTLRTVQNYLEKGDVTAFFNYLLSGTSIILDKLYKINETTDKYEMAPIRQFWELNQVYSEILMAGQYSAQIFFEVSNTSY